MRHPDFTAKRTEAAAHHSSYVEACLQQQLIAHLSSALWQRTTSKKLKVFTSQVDDAGFDLVLKIGGEIRYVQLKQTHEGKLPPFCSVRLSFAEIEGACVILMLYSLGSLLVTATRFLCIDKFETLERMRSSQASLVPGRRNALGERKRREGYRDAPVSLFQKMCDWDFLLLSLFPMLTLQISESTQTRGPHSQTPI